MNECIFCVVASRNNPHHEIWWSDDAHIAFLDISPSQRGHTLVIPRKHVENIIDLSEEDYSTLLLSVKEVASKLREFLKIDKVGIIIEGMSIPHLHVHLIPIRQKGDLGMFPKYELQQNELIELGNNLRKFAG